jgi:hypothetical protein
VLSSATQLVEIIPGSSRTRFRDRPETVRLHPGIGVHLRPGTVFGIIPEYRSDSSRNRVHVRPESPRMCAVCCADDTAPTIKQGFKEPTPSACTTYIVGWNHPKRNAKLLINVENRTDA